MGPKEKLNQAVVRTNSRELISNNNYFAIIKVNQK
jgi:hypothetical protein